MPKDHTYYMYITTNPRKTVLYVGVTNNLGIRLRQHLENKDLKKTFAGKYHCYNLVYYEDYQYIMNAIAREKQIKKWNRAKKEELINKFNPGWKTLNGQFWIEDIME